MALVTKIKEYREQAGYKQSELAELVGARRETIVHLENGRYNPSLKLAMDIAKEYLICVFRQQFVLPFLLGVGIQNHLYQQIYPIHNLT